MRAAKPKKQRADQALVDRGLVETKSKAQALIMAGLVYSGEQKIAKPGQPTPEDKPLEVRGQDHPWVSRGGLKLAKGLAAFAIDPAGMTGLDVGASTGGFTDVLLQNGAAKVYAVDVGRGQLHWKLRNDPARGGSGEHQCPPSEPHGDPRTRRYPGLRRQLHRS